MCKKLFIDMDGTLNKWFSLEDPSILYLKGYYLSCRPHLKLIEGIKLYMKKHPDVECFILTSYFDDSLYAKREKELWLDYYIPEIPVENRIFVPYGTLKTEFAAMHDKVGKIDSTCFLLDDYSNNLHEWDSCGGVGIKCKTNINGNHGTWKGNELYYKADIDDIAETLEHFINTDIPEDAFRQYPILAKIRAFEIINTLSESALLKIEKILEAVEKEQLILHIPKRPDGEPDYNGEFRIIQNPSYTSTGYEMAVLKWFEGFISTNKLLEYFMQ